jgi:hypothetical protein
LKVRSDVDQVRTERARGISMGLEAYCAGPGDGVPFGVHPCTMRIGTINAASSFASDGPCCMQCGQPSPHKSAP